MLMLRRFRPSANAATENPAAEALPAPLPSSQCSEIKTLQAPAPFISLLERLNSIQMAGTLAHRLYSLAGGDLKKVYFACSSSEGVESAIKFARKRTGRTCLIDANSAFHGLTCRTLSLMHNRFWKDKFGRPHGTLFVLDEVQTGLFRTGTFLAKALSQSS